MNYKFLKRQTFSEGVYSLVPVRHEDRLDIMQWRNEQIRHLRQQKPLTVVDQDKYFEETVAGLFEHDRPSQLLFSFLENATCIGYGGLVHINHHDRHAEVSFIMNTALETDYFEKHWLIYLRLIENVAFGEAGLHKIFTWAFDVRPHLYPVLEEAGFTHEARLKEQVLFEGKFIDAVIHAKIN